MAQSFYANAYHAQIIICTNVCISELQYAIITVSVNATAHKDLEIPSQLEPC